MKEKNNIIVAVVGLIFIFGVIVFAVFDFINKNENPTKYDSFAECLASKGAVMYGAEWCSHCKAQKAMFGSSFKYIDYVECPENTNICLDKGIEAYPTWTIGTSTRIVGEVTLKRLAEISGCELPEK